MRLVLDASYGRAKFTDTAEKGPGNWVPPSPPIVHLGLVVPSSCESVSCRQAIRARSQVGEACGGGGGVGGVWCVCCRGWQELPETHSQRAGKQAIKEGRGESSSAAQAWPIKTQHSFPQCACPLVTKPRQGRKRTRKRKKTSNKQNQTIKRTSDGEELAFFGGK